MEKQKQSKALDSVTDKVQERELTGANVNNYIVIFYTFR